MVVSAVELTIVAAFGVRNVGPDAVPIVMSAAVRMGMRMPADVCTVARMRRLIPAAVPIVVAAVLVVVVVAERDTAIPRDQQCRRGEYDEEQEGFLHVHEYSTPLALYKVSTTKTFPGSLPRRKSRVILGADPKRGVVHVQARRSERRDV